METTKLYRFILVCMILTFTNGHRVKKNLEFAP